MNEQDTTAVLPLAASQPTGQAETRTGSSSTPHASEWVAQSGYQAMTGPPAVPAQSGQPGGAGAEKGAKPATERKRSGRLSEDRRFKIFCGSANRPLAEEVCKFVGVPLGETRLQRFSDGEVHFQLLENVRGADVFLIQPTCFPVDQNLVELLIMMDALKRASAARVTVVIPYYGYARQDRKDRPRVAITSKLVADVWGELRHHQRSWPVPA